MNTLITLLDRLYYDILTPFFLFLGRLLELLLLAPLTAIGAPPWLQVAWVGLVCGLCSLWLRRLLRMAERAETFRQEFAARRKRQQQLQLVRDKYQRSAMYEVTDDELNEKFNTYLAHHYARYVAVYLLPVFLTMAWLNRVFTETFLRQNTGGPWLVPMEGLPFGAEGLTVGAVFLLTYLLVLILGMNLKRLKRTNRDDTAS